MDRGVHLGSPHKLASFCGSLYNIPIVGIHRGGGYDDTKKVFLSTNVFVYQHVKN